MNVKALLAALDDVEGMADQDVGEKLKGLAGKKKAPAAVEVEVSKAEPVLAVEEEPEGHDCCPTCGKPMEEKQEAAPFAEEA